LNRFLEGIGFALERIKGAHHIFSHPSVPRPFPVQSVKGQAKPYQVRQLIEFVEMYRLRLQDEDAEETNS